MYKNRLRVCVATLAGAASLCIAVQAKALDPKLLGSTPFFSKPVMDAVNKPAPRWVAVAKILCPMSKSQLGMLTLNNKRTPPPKTLDIQQALAFFGFDPGPLDGLPGPATRKAGAAYAAALIGPGRTCLQLQEARYLLKAHSWSKALAPEQAAAIIRDHGRLGLARSFYGRNQPPPGVKADPAQDDCKAHANAQLLGQPLPDDLPESTGVTELRVIRILESPAITMDYRPSRLNLELDGFDRVNTISCG